MEQDLAHSLYCIPVGHLGTEEHIRHISLGYSFKSTDAFSIGCLAYSTGFPLASHEEVPHVRDKCERTPAGTDSNSLHHLSGHNDTPLSHTGTGMPQERPDERSGGKR